MAFIRQTVLALLAAMALGGCAAVERAVDVGAENPLLAQYAIKSTTARLIVRSELDPARVQEVALSLSERVDSGAHATMDAIEERVREEIPWGEMLPSDRELVNLLIAGIRATIEQRIGDGALQANERVYVATVLRWVSEAARLVPEQ